MNVCVDYFKTGDAAERFITDMGLVYSRKENQTGSCIKDVLEDDIAA